MKSGLFKDRAMGMGCALVFLLGVGLAGYGEPQGGVREPRQQLSAAGQALVTIVTADQSTPEERTAIGDLATYLGKITGASFQVTNEAAFEAATPAVYVGQTDFARRAGVAFPTFSEQEYAIKSLGENLVITGGSPRGVINGVYHLLTYELGCRFFRWDCEQFPQRENLTLAGLNIRRKPSFAGREIYLPPWSFGYTPEGGGQIWAFMRRNFGNRYVLGQRSLTRDAQAVHNEYFWVCPALYAESNPEFFSLALPGGFRKLPQEGDCGRNQEGVLCWTNPRVWEITLDKLREVIEKDRSALPEGMWPTLYQVGQNDVHCYCRCANCLAVFEQEGSFAGPLLNYVNFVAEGIAAKYPDVNIMTSAYVGTEDTPKNIRPAPNVMIMWTDLYTRSDCYRPLLHEFNAAQKARLDGWGKIAHELAVWDYWNMGIAGGYFYPPRVETMVDAIAPDLRLFHESGAISVFCEAEFCHKTPQNFIDLQYYVGYQILADVTLDEEQLINDYMEAVYGPAVPAMKQFLSMLREAVKNEPNPLFSHNKVRTYTDGAFLEEVYRLLKKAQAAVAPGSDYYRRIQQEMIAPLAVIILNPQYGFFARTGIVKETVIDEYRAARLSRIEQPWVSEKRRNDDLAELETDITIMTLEFPIPEFLKDRGPLRTFTWPQMIPSGWQKGRGIEMVEDSDSAIGKAVVARGQEEARHDLNKPFAGGLYPDSFGIYSPIDKRSSKTIRTGVPQDEKYHWYCIPAFDLGRGNYLWMFYWLMKVDLSTAFETADGIEGHNIWETWLSVKYTGPAYVNGSTQTNGVYIDQVILVRPKTETSLP